MEKTEVYNPIPASLERVFIHLQKQIDAFEKSMLKYDKHNSEKENDNDNSKLFRPVRADGR